MLAPCSPLATRTHVLLTLLPKIPAGRNLKAQCFIPPYIQAVVGPCKGDLAHTLCQRRVKKIQREKSTEIQRDELAKLSCTHFDPFRQIFPIEVKAGGGRGGGG